MHSRVEFLAPGVGIARVWREAPDEPGPCPDVQYEWACVVCWLTDDSVEIKIGWPGCTVSAMRAVLAELRRHGVHTWAVRRVGFKGLRLHRMGPSH